MNGEIDIDGHSRGFQLAVLAIAIGVLLTALIAVGAIATSPGDFGVGLDDENAEDHRDFFEWVGSDSSEDNATTNHTEDDGTGSDGGEQQADDSGGESSDDGVLPDGDGEMRDMLDADDVTTLFSDRSGNDARSDQLSPDSLRSFLGDTHFTVNSDRDGRTYWRSTTFDEYTGEGVRDTSPPSPDNTISLTDYSGDTTADTNTHTVTLQEDATRIPSPGDPTNVEILSGANPDAYEFKRSGDGTVIVTDGNGNVQPLPEGTQIEITATDTPGGGGGTGADDGRYLETSDNLPDRVGEQASDITTAENAETNQEKADAITSWMQTNKEYRADSGTDESSDGVDQFLFEMDGGDSTHFATSTTVMLREEGVPARVATGYQDDPADGNDVTSMDQHAWVEVYTEDDGWVAYDPTPDEESAVKEDVQAGDDTAVEYGVHEDVIQGWDEDDPAVTGEDSDGDGAVAVEDADGSQAPGPPYDITVRPDPTPGTEVTVQVTSGGTPIHGAEVHFNGDPVGKTGPDGRLTAQVPYTDSLTVTATPPSDSDDSTQSQQQVFFSGASAPGGALATTEHNETDSSETFDLPTNVSVASDRLLVPGEPVTASFTIDGNPVPGVTVYVDGEYAGETDQNGEVEIRVPESASAGDTITVRVERDELSSETSITVAEPMIHIDAGLLALPGDEAEVTVVATNGEREEVVPNQTVTVADSDGSVVTGGENVTLDENGTATITLPWSNSVTVSTSLYGADTETTITGLYYRVAALFIGTVLLVGGVGAAAYRRGITLAVIRERGYELLFTTAAYVHSAGSRLYNTVVRITATVRRLAANIRERVTTVDSKRIVRSPKIAVKRVLRFLRALPALIRELFTLPGFVGAVSNNPPETNTSGHSASSDRTQSPYARICGCWRWLVRYVMGRTNRTSKTTVEIGDEAIERGFPARPVTRLRRAFQDVEYGPHEPGTRVDDAEQAVDTLRGETNDTNDSSQNNPEGDAR